MEDMKPIDVHHKMEMENAFAKKSESKNLTSKDINDQIDEFFANGGKITKCPNPEYDERSNQVGITGNYMGGGIA